MKPTLEDIYRQALEQVYAVPATPENTKLRDLALHALMRGMETLATDPGAKYHREDAELHADLVEKLNQRVAELEAAAAALREVAHARLAELTHMLVQYEPACVCTRFGDESLDNRPNMRRCIEATERALAPDAGAALRAELDARRIEVDRLNGAVMELHTVKKEARIYHDALTDICNPIAAIQAAAKARGERIDGAAAKALSRDPEHLRMMAADALRAGGLAFMGGPAPLAPNEPTFTAAEVLDLVRRALEAR